MEGQDPSGTDPIDLQLPRGATGNGREQSTPQTTAPVSRLTDTKSLLQVTPYHGDKASFLGWKWSFLIAVRAISKPLHEGFKTIEDNMNQDFRKSRLSAGDLELSDQAYTVLALLCKDEACAYVRSAYAKAFPLPRMVRSQTRDSRSFREVGAKNKKLKGVEVAKRYC